MLQELLAALAPHLIELIVGAVALFILPKLYAFLHISVDDSRRSVIETALQNALEYAVAQVLGQRPNPANIGKSKDEIIKVATDYVIQNVPSVLAKLGIGSAAVAQLLEARLPAILAKVRDRIA